MFATLRQLTARLRPGRFRALAGTMQILGIAFALGLVFYVARPADTAANTRASPAGEAAGLTETAVLTRVDVMRPEAASATLTVQTTGSVQVRSYAELATEVTGRVQSVSDELRDGGRFEAGDILLVLDPTDFELALAQAEADVASARANLLLEEAQRDVAVKNYGLLNPKASVPPLVAREPQIRQAKATLDATLARLAIAETNLARTRFSLPFDGRVVASTAEVGQVLNRAASFGQAFALDAVEAAIPLAPDDLEKIRPARGRLVEINSHNHSLHGTIDRLSAELETNTRFATAYIPVADSDLLPPGAFVTAELQGMELTEAFVLPERAEQVGGQAWTVQAGKLVEITLDIHARRQGAIVVSVFDYGEGIVLGAVPGAYEGLPVRAVEDPRYTPPRVVGDATLPSIALGPQ